MYSGEQLPGYSVEFCDVTDTEGVCEQLTELAERAGQDAKRLKPYTVYAENVMINATVTLDRAPEIEAGGQIGVHVALQAKQFFEDEPRTLQLRWILPDGFTAEGRSSLMTKAFNPHTSGKGEADFIIRAGETVAPENRLVLEIFTNGRCTPLYVYFPLYS
jgi:hypothetical protein